MAGLKQEKGSEGEEVNQKSEPKEEEIKEMPPAALGQDHHAERPELQHPKGARDAPEENEEKDDKGEAKEKREEEENEENEENEDDGGEAERLCVAVLDALKRAEQRRST